MFELQVQELRLPCLCVEDRHAEQRVRGGGGPGGEGEVVGLAQLLPHPPVEMGHPAMHSGGSSLIFGNQPAVLSRPRHRGARAPGHAH